MPGHAIEGKNGGPQLVRGTLDMMILRVLSAGAQHGYAITRRIEQASGGVLGVEEGSLYPALHRLVKKGLLESEWKQSENNRRAKYYRLTAAGDARLQSDQENWLVVVEAIGRVMRGEGLDVLDTRGGLL